MKKFYIILFAVILFISSFIITSYIVKSNKKEENENVEISEEIEDECTEEYIQSEKIEPVVVEEEKIAVNAQMILKKYYKQCEHTINEYVEIPQECVNMTKDELQNQYNDWKVIGFASNKVTLYKEIDDICGEHFKLKVEDGKINIYLLNSDGSESLYEKTNISSEYLTETDIMNINDMEIYGKEDLNKIIEDFE